MVVKFVRSLSVWNFPVQSTEKASFVPKRQDPKALGYWGRMSLAQKPSAAMGGKMHEKGERKGFASGTSAQFGKALAYGCVQIFCRCTFSGQEVCGMSLVPSSNLAHCRKKPGRKDAGEDGLLSFRGPLAPKKFAHGKDFFGPWKAFCFQRAASVKTLGKGFSKFVRGARTMRESRHFFLFVNLRARLFWQVDRPELYGNIGPREVGKCLAGPNRTR